LLTYLLTLGGKVHSVRSVAATLNTTTTHKGPADKPVMIISYESLKFTAVRQTEGAMYTLDKMNE